MSWAAAAGIKVLIRRMRVSQSFRVVSPNLLWDFATTCGISSGIRSLGLGNWSEPRVSAFCMYVKQMSYCLRKGRKEEFSLIFFLAPAT